MQLVTPEPWRWYLGGVEDVRGAAAAEFDVLIDAMGDYFGRGWSPQVAAKAPVYSSAVAPLPRPGLVGADFAPTFSACSAHEAKRLNGKILQMRCAVVIPLTSYSRGLLSQAAATGAAKTPPRGEGQQRANAHAQRVNQSQDLAPPQEGPAGLPVVWNNRRLAPAQLRQAALVLRDMGPAAKVLIYTLRYAHSAGPMGNLSAIQQKTDGPYA